MHSRAAGKHAWFIIPSSSSPTTLHKLFQQNFPNLHREAFAEIRSETKRTYPSYSNTRAFRTSPIYIARTKAASPETSQEQKPFPRRSLQVAAVSFADSNFDSPQPLNYVFKIYKRVNTDHPTPATRKGVGHSSAGEPRGFAETSNKRHKLLSSSRMHTHSSLHEFKRRFKPTRGWQRKGW